MLLSTQKVSGSIAVPWGTIFIHSGMHTFIQQIIIEYHFRPSTAWYHDKKAGMAVVVMESLVKRGRQLLIR